MSSGEAFNQVKALLGKLDRSIDEARARRTGTGDDEPRADGREPGREPGRDTETPGRDVSAQGAPNGAGQGAAHSHGTPDTPVRRESLNQPLGASPTNSNPTRRPGIGRARPLNRQPPPPAPAPEREAGDDDTWVGGGPDNDD